MHPKFAAIAVDAVVAYSCTIDSACKVGRSKPPMVLTGGFNRLKLPQSICQNVVNTGQYESEWSIEIFKWAFWCWIETLGQVLCSIY